MPCWIQMLLLDRFELFGFIQSEEIQRNLLHNSWKRVLMNNDKIQQINNFS